MEETKEIEWPEEMKTLIYNCDERKELTELLCTFLPGPLVGIIIEYKFPWCIDYLFVDDILRQFRLSTYPHLFKWNDQSIYQDCRSLYRLYRRIKNIEDPNIPASETYFCELIEYMMKPFYSPNINKITISMNGSLIIRRDIFPVYGSYCFGDLIKDFLQLINNIIADMGNLFINTLVSESSYIRSCDISNGNSDDSLLINMNINRGYGWISR